MLTGIGDVISDLNFVTEGGFTRILQRRCRETLRSEILLNMKQQIFSPLVQKFTKLQGVTFHKKLSLLRTGFPAFNYLNIHHYENIKFRAI